MIARHRFHEGHKESDYEIARRHLKICEQNCTRLKSTGDLSVCYWTLGEKASNKQYFSKASMFYEKAINTYSSAKTLSKFQPSLSVIYAHYSYALAGKDHLLPQSQTTYDVEDEHRPNPQSHVSQPGSVTESGTPNLTQSTYQSPELVSDIHSVNEGSTISPDTMDYKSKIRWPKGIPCKDASRTYCGTVVTGSHECLPEYELEEAVEEGLSTTVIDEEPVIGMPSSVQPFLTICGE
jgi:hypothetical protein